MASSHKLKLSFLISMFLASLLLVSVSCHEFQVGGVNGWTVPSLNHTLPYNFWATHNRFHINDTLRFEYRDDSVLVVNYTDYRDCVVSDPILRFEDGDTVFAFDRHGFFYFISGRAGHCEAGQKLVVRVMVHPPESDSPMMSPDGSGPPSVSSSDGRAGSGFCSMVGVFVMLGLLL